MTNQVCNTVMIPVEEYEALRRKVEELEIALADKKFHHEQLTLLFAKLEAENAELRQIVAQFVKSTQVEHEPVAWVDLRYGRNTAFPHSDDVYTSAAYEYGELRPLYLHPAPIPSTHVLVPKELTESMYAACDNERLAQIYWRKLIAAAQGEK
jgi:hypothetical protein